MPHELLLSRDWRSAEAWLTERLPPSPSIPLPGPRVLVPTRALSGHLERRWLAAGPGWTGPLFDTLTSLAAGAAPSPPCVPVALRSWALVRLTRTCLDADGPLARLAAAPGCAGLLDDLVGQLRAAGVQPEALHRLAAEQGSPRLAEVARLHAAWESLCRERGWADETALLEAAAAALGHGGLPHPPERFVLYGFRGFRRAELELVRALAAAAPCTFVCPGLARHPVLLAALLRHVRDAVGPLEVRTLPAQGRRAAPQALLTAADPPRLVEAAARQLRRLRHEDPSLSWSDCALVCRTVGPYRRWIEELLPRVGVPCTMASPVPWSEIRALTYLCGLVAWRTSGYARGPLLDCLRSSCCPLDLDADVVDQLAVQLPACVPPRALRDALRRLAGQLHRLARRSDEDGDLPADLASRAAAVRRAADTAPVLARLDALPEQASLPTYAGLLSSLAGEATRLPPLIGPSGAWPADAARRARDHRACQAFADTLERMGRAWPVEIGLAELGALCRLLQRREVLAPAPGPSAGVAVLDAEEAAGSTFRVVIALGLRRGEWPAPAAATPLLAPEDRRRVFADGATGPAAQAAGEELLFESVAEAAAERLYLAWPRVDAEGRSALPSPLVEADTVAPGASRTHGRGLAPGTGTPEPLPLAADDLWHAEEAAAWAVDRLRGGQVLAPGPAELLADLVRRGGIPGLDGELARWHAPELTAYDGVLDPHPALRRRLARQWAGRPLSPTRLDAYGRCPWRFFAEQVLALPVPEDEDLEIAPVDRGRLLHAIVERFFRERRDAGGRRVRPLGAQAPEELLEAIDHIAGEEADRLERAGRAGHPGAWPYEVERLRHHLHAFVRGELAREASPDGGTPAYLEVSFGTREHRGSDPASTDEPLVLTEGGLSIQARGIIDRIDLLADGSAVVIDYKTGSSVPSVPDVQGGISFQLFVYLLAARHLLGLEPRSACYLMLTEAPGARGWLPRRGELRCDAPSGRTRVDWPALEHHARAYLAAYARDLAAGSFPVLPYPAAPEEKACGRCPFGAVCRFEPERLLAARVPATLRFARIQRMREGRDA